MTYPLRKGLSLQHSMTVDGAANDYRSLDNPAVVQNSYTRWVKVWLNWNILENGQTAAPQSAAESWDRLNVSTGGTGGGSILARLDKIIKAINDDSARLNALNGGSISVIIQIDAGTPKYARQAGQESDPYSVPNDVSSGGPWGWFIAHLCARYKAAPVNDIGPHYETNGRPANMTGNTTGAVVQAIEFVNEPNYLYTLSGPNQSLAGLACVVATMMKTAANFAAFWGSPSAVFGPGILDSASGQNDQPALDFAGNVLGALKGWLPPTGVYVGWTMHGYGDVKYRSSLPASSTTAAKMQNLLTTYKWKTTGERMLWITETGYNMFPDPGPDVASREANQARLVDRNFTQMEQLQDVVMYMTHEIVDPLSAAGAFQSGLKRADYSDKPLKTVWFNRVGANKALN